MCAGKPVRTSLYNYRIVSGGILKLIKILGGVVALEVE